MDFSQVVLCNVVHKKKKGKKKDKTRQKQMKKREKHWKYIFAFVMEKVQINS